MTEHRAHLLHGSWMTLLLAASVVAQAQWSELQIAGPSARFGHGMVAEGTTGNMLLFGGYAGPDVYSRELWRFDGDSWALVVGNGPVGRYLPGLAFDAARGRLVLFGGVTAASAHLSDCWEWDGVSWMERTSPGPVARLGHWMTFDSQRSRTVMFGGIRSDGAPLGDTWEWDGSNWIPRFTPSAPASRHRHRMVFDSRRGVTVLHGGMGQQGALGDTWEFDGSNWQLRATASPRLDFQMAYDQGWERVVLHGGESPSAGWANDVRVWSGQFWATVVTPSIDLQCSSGTLAFDPVRRRMVLFGGARSGSGANAETWILDGSVAQQQALGSGCGNPPLALTETVSGMPVIGRTAQLDITSAPLGLAFLTIGTRSDWFGGFPLPVLLDGLGMPGCSIQHSTDLYSSWPASPVGATTARASVAVPNDLAFLGVSLYLQAWAPAPGANTAEFIVSNSLRWTFGDH